jgi:hypothetical protein
MFLIGAIQPSKCPVTLVKSRRSQRLPPDHSLSVAVSQLIRQEESAEGATALKPDYGWQRSSRTTSERSSTRSRITSRLSCQMSSREG